MSAEAKENAELAMEEAIEAVKQRLARIRTGKASPAILDGVKVEYYGAPTPLKQLATDRRARAAPADGQALRPLGHRRHREGPSRPATWG